MSRGYPLRPGMLALKGFILIMSRDMFEFYYTSLEGDKMREIPREIKNFFDEEGRLKIWPGKRKKQLLALAYIAEYFHKGREYTEKEINELLEKVHAFNDSALLRRELFELGYLNREKDGSSYWRERVDDYN